MRSTPIALVAVCIVAGCVEGETRTGRDGDADGSTAWVTADRLNRRTCPSANCGVVGQLFFREKATILQDSSGWARISRYYDASCRNGESEYVDSGNARCESSNGIVEGRFAEWVSLQYLSSTRPADPAAGAEGYHALVSGSDDYGRFGDAFAEAAADLIQSGQCSRADFEEMGGWYKSTTRHPNEPIYFTYCGGMTAANRLYLNAETGSLVR